MISLIESFSFVQSGGDRAQTDGPAVEFFDYR